MKKYNIKTLSELSDKAKNDLDWYWKAVDEDIGIVWFQKYYHSIILHSPQKLGIMLNRFFG